MLPIGNAYGVNMQNVLMHVAYVPLHAPQALHIGRKMIPHPFFARQGLHIHATDR
jgi:hypothetical protein